MTQAQLEKDYGMDYVKLLAGHSMRVIPANQASSKTQQKTYQIIKTSPTFKLCSDQNQFKSAITKDFGSDLVCQPSLGDSTTKEPQTKFTFRSIKNIYDFLGQVTEAQLDNPPYLLTLPPTDETLAKKSKANESNRFALLVVNRNKDEKTFSTMEALNDNTYSIPRENNGYSTLVINLLAQFQALAKSPGSIPSSPAVLIK